MARDESTEGWLPLQGGGMANVSIRRRSRLAPEVKGHEYIIYGQRVPDGTVSNLVLSPGMQLIDLTCFFKTGDSKLRYQ